MVCKVMKPTRELATVPTLLFCFIFLRGGAESGVAEQRRRRDEERAQRENGMARGKLKQNIYICKLVLTRCN